MPSAEEERPTGLFIGRSTIDLVALVDRFPAADEKISAREMLLVAGGPALNAAITFAHLGGRATLVSSFGTSQLASVAMAECRTLGVTVIDLAAGRPYGFPVSMVASAREDASRCIINSPAAAADTRGPASLELPVEPSIVLLDQFELGAATTIVPPLRAAGVPIVLDGGSWKDVSPAFLDLATVPIVSSRFRPPDHRTAVDAAAHFERRAFANWAVTRGAQGVTYGEDGATRHMDAIKVQAVDTLAAGDIFHGAFCFAFATGHPFGRSLKFASNVAARSCRFGGPRGWMTKNTQT